MNRGVFDASVLVKLMVEEPGFRDAEAVYAQCRAPTAPGWALVECAQAFRNKARRQDKRADEMMLAYEGLTELELEYIDATDALPTALALALRLNHSVYDCLYVATAMQEAAPLVTADAKLAALADRCGVEVVRIGDS